MDLTLARPPFGAAIYLSGEEVLKLTVLNGLVGVTVELRGRFLPAPTDRDPNPAVTPFRESVTPASDRSVVTVLHALGEGWLLDASVIATAGSPAFGLTFVALGLARGQSASGFELTALAQGYVTSVQRVAWPGSGLPSALDGQGALKVIVGANPGAGLEIAEAVPATVRWDLLSFAATFTTSAAAANRTPSLRFDAGGAVYGRFPVQTFVTASVAPVLTWAPGAPGISPAPLVTQQVAIPIGIRLQNGHIIRTVTNLIDAGDAYTNIRYLVREWVAAET